MSDETVLPRNFGWLIKSKLAGCGRPETEAELEGCRVQVSKL